MARTISVSTTLLACLLVGAIAFGCRPAAPPEVHASPESSKAPPPLAPPPAAELLFSWKAGPLRALSLSRDDVLVLRGPFDGEDTLVAVGRASPHATTALGSCKFGGAVAGSDAEHVVLGCPGTPKTTIGFGSVARQPDGTVDLVELSAPHRGERTRLLADVESPSFVAVAWPFVTLLEPHSLRRIDVRATPIAPEKVFAGNVTFVHEAVVAGASTWLVQGSDLRRIEASGSSEVHHLDGLTELLDAYDDGSAMVALGAKLGVVTTAGVLTETFTLDGAVIDGAVVGGSIFALTRGAIWCGRAAPRPVKELDGVLDAFEAMAVDERELAVAMRRSGNEEIWRFDRAALGCDR